MTRIVSFWLLVAIIVAVSLGFYRVMSGFLLPLFLAALMVVIFKPVHEWLLARLRNTVGAAALATVAVVLIVFVPMIWSLTLAANEAISVAKQFDANRVTRQIQRIQVLFRLDLPLLEETLELSPLFDDLVREPEVPAVAVDQAAPSDMGEPPADDGVREDQLEGQTEGQSNTAPVVDTPSSLPVAARGRVPSDSSLSPGSTLPSSVTPNDMLGDTPPYFIERLVTLETVRYRLNEIRRELPLRQPVAARPELSEVYRQFDLLGQELAQVQTALDEEDKDLFLETAQSAKRDFERLQGMLPSGAWRVVMKRLVYPNAQQVQELKDRLVREVQELLVPAANATAGFAAKLLFGTIIMIVSVFFFFADGKKMTDTVMRLIPLDMRHQQELLTEFGRISRAVVLATLVSALVQGILAGIGFYFADTGSVALLILLTIVFAMIPFVGALSVWAPVVAWMGFVEGRVWTAVLLAIYCAIVVSQSDNVVKPLILKGQSNIHPLLALLSILGGVQALGPVGILVGPMIVVFLQTLLNILHREMTSLEQSPERPAAGSTG